MLGDRHIFDRCGPGTDREVINLCQQRVAIKPKVAGVDPDETGYVGLARQVREAVVLDALQQGLANARVLRGIL